MHIQRVTKWPWPRSELEISVKGPTKPSVRLAHRYDTPLVADIHFQPAVAMLVAEAFEKIRINPGNFADGRKTFEEINYDDPAQFRAEQEHICEVRCQATEASPTSMASGSSSYCKAYMVKKGLLCRPQSAPARQGAHLAKQPWCPDRAEQLRQSHSRLPAS